jgi:hypothetical protein
MAYTISFKHYSDQLIDQVRAAARAEGWTGTAGFKEWARETFKGTLRSGSHSEWTSISFRTEDGLNKFKLHFKIADQRHFESKCQFRFFDGFGIDELKQLLATAVSTDSKDVYIPSENSSQGGQCRLSTWYVKALIEHYFGVEE